MKSLTMCLLTCGEPTTDECLDSIQHEWSKFTLDRVEHVTPQIRALNLMLDRCETEYLVPLDADMLLNFNFFERIESAIDEHEDDPTWHSILFPLWDTLTQQKILALKVLRMPIMRQCPFKESSTPDINHFTDLTNMGYRCISNYLEEEPIGNHVVRGSYFCYMKYRDVYQTMRSHQRLWVPGVAKGNTVRECAINHFNFFMGEFNKTRNEDYKHCIAGMLDGLTSEISNQSKSLEHPVRIDIDQIDKQFLNWLLECKNPQFTQKLGL